MALSSFQLRTLSAIIIAPLFLYVIYVGGAAFNTIIGLAFIRAAYEWIRMVRKIETKTALFIVLLSGGLLYGILSFWSFVVLRELSLELIALFLVLIWSSDIGGYVFGKTFGGFKPVPTISPNKTISGFAGAFLTPAILSALWAFIHFGAVDSVLFYAFFGVATGVAGQVGDLIVSSVKRKSGVKDTGRLIPGHGGLLDRIDSMMMASPVFLGLVTMPWYV